MDIFVEVLLCFLGGLVDWFIEIVVGWVFVMAESFVGKVECEDGIGGVEWVIVWLNNGFGVEVDGFC